MRLIPYAMALALGVAVAGTAADTPKASVEAEGAAVTLVGQISSQPRDFGVTREEKMQVAVGPHRIDHTLHLRTAEMYNANGKRVYVSDMLDKFWVRAEGTRMSDPRRIKVDRLWVLGKDDAAYMRSAHYQPALHHGFVQTVAGARQVFRSEGGLVKGTHVNVVGEVTSQPRDIGFTVEKKMQVGIGPAKTDYTLHAADAKIFDYHGKEISIDDIQDKMWVYAEGEMMDDPRRVKVTRMQVIGGNQAGMKSSRFSRSGWDHGYLLERSEFHRLFPQK